MSVKLPPPDGFRDRLEGFDRFREVWASASAALPPATLSRWREKAKVESIASSCRIAGIKVSEGEVTALVRGQACPLPDAAALLGYAHAVERPVPDSGHLLTVGDLQSLNAVVLGEGGADPAPRPFRETPLHHEAFDGEGRATGRVFQTLPPRLVRDKLEDLVSWLELELRSRENHPALVIGAFSMAFLAASPFEQGNGRMARLLATHLLRREGYGHLPYASLERIVEERRPEYHEAHDKSTTYLWTGEADVTPWLEFWVEVLSGHRARLERIVATEMGALDLPPLQRKILETVREHGTAAAALLMASTGANRNTLKDNLRRLVERQLLERVGQKRGTYYRLRAVARPSEDS